jgi:hypothetical protein
MVRPKSTHIVGRFEGYKCPGMKMLVEYYKYGASTHVYGFALEGKVEGKAGKGVDKLVTDQIAGAIKYKGKWCKQVEIEVDRENAMNQGISMEEYWKQKIGKQLAD